jgi:ribosome-binding factor A
VQAAVGTQTRLRRTPRLRFEPDPVVEQVDRVETVLREVKADDDAHD